jgi:hypothetical protein
MPEDQIGQQATCLTNSKCKLILVFLVTLASSR